MNNSSSPLVAELWLAYPIPLVLMLLAATGINTILGIFFSPHGGIGWLLLLAAFPWVLIRAGVLAIRAPKQTQVSRRQHALYVLAAYVPLSALSSYFIAARLSPPLQLTMANTLPWYYFPLSLLLPGW